MRRLSRMFVLVYLCCGTASAERLYSIDNLSPKRLVRVESTTGAITVVGEIPGFNGTITDMEFLGDRLYAVANVSPDKRLLELDVATGAILSSALITDEGAAIMNAAEGLAADDKGNLLISFWFPGGPMTMSAQIGLLGLDGMITFPVNLGMDFDGLCRRRAGGLFAIDRDSVAMSSAILRVFHAPPSVLVLNTIPFATGFNGVDEVAQGRFGLYAVDFINQQVHRLDADTAALLASVPLDAGFMLVPLAAPPPCLGDADGDGDHDFGDITSVLTNFGMTGEPFAEGDADGGGDVSFGDITAVLTAFGLPCLP